MTSLSPARRAALSLLGEARRRDARVRDLLRESPRMAGLAPRDRALAMRLVMGTTSARSTLDARIDAHLVRGRLEPRVRDALRLAAFELMYLSTPAAVAVDQGVALVRRSSPHAAGLANAVLRRTAEEDRPAVAASRARVEGGGGETADLALVGGLPDWLVRALVGSVGTDGAARAALTALDAAPVFVAANLARHKASEVRELLAQAGLDPRDTTLPSAFALGRPAGLARSGLVEAVDVLPCDLAAQLVALVAASCPGQRLLEVGSGRGTKSVLLAGAARAQGGRVRLAAVDADEGRVRVARERMVRAGLADEVSCLALDGRALAGDGVPEEVAGTFDAVFLDAPCSGVGTLRRHPEIAWSLDEASLEPENPDGLPRLQGQLLEAAATRVAVGGTLVYATCSPLRAEDEDVVAAFLESPAGAGFVAEPVSGAPGVVAAGEGALRLVKACETPQGFLRTTGSQGEDLHFAARLRRVG